MSGIARPLECAAIQTFYEGVCFTPGELQIRKGVELYGNRQQSRREIEVQNLAAIELERFVQVMQQQEQAEAERRARFATIQSRFGTAVALLDRGRWNLRNFSAGELDYLMACGEKVRSLNVSNCRLPEGFGRIVRDVFPRLTALYVRNTNFSDDDLKELARSSIDILDMRGTRVMRGPQRKLYNANREAERAKLLRFQAVEARFGKAIAIIDQNGWDFEKMNDETVQITRKLGEGITWLSFSSCKLPEKFGFLIAEFFPNLERLDVSHTNFRDDDASFVSQYLPLKYLNLTATHVTTFEQRLHQIS